MPANSLSVSPGAFLVDLAIYLPVIFLIREVYFQRFGFMANGLFWSFTGLAVAAWRMKVRGVTWAELGLCKLAHIKELVTATERSITVGLIGLGMGVGYVLFGRNLWSFILAHCVLNTVSMLDRVG